ncbi:MAG: hypothetical protein PV340_04120 [Wolbachia sp.]|nr:hypothetical protein [Wolbachia sp.]MDD9336396.1 hypothetical protein [Wolbachia sp.]
MNPSSNEGNEQQVEGDEIVTIQSSKNANYGLEESKKAWEIW